MSETKVIEKEKTQQYLTKNVTIPFGIIAFTNLLSFLHIVPVFPQLLLNSSCCVFIGCVLGSKLAKKPSGELAKA